MGERRSSAEQAQSWELLGPGLGTDLDLSWIGDKFFPVPSRASHIETSSLACLNQTLTSTAPAPMAWGMAAGSSPGRSRSCSPQATSHPWQDCGSPGSLPETCPAGTGEAVTCGHVVPLQGTSWKRKHKSRWLCGFLAVLCTDQLISFCLLCVFSLGGT